MIDPNQHPPDPRSPGHVLERHAQTIGIGLMTLALAWVGGTLRSMYDGMIEQKSAIEELHADMSDLSAQIRDVRGQLAQVPTQREIDARFDGLGRRIEALERRKQH